MITNNDFEWMVNTPADEYEVGEELYFRIPGYAFVTGTFLRQWEGNITIKVTEVLWGPDEWYGTEMEFNKKNISEKLDEDSIISNYLFEFKGDEWTEELEYEEELNEDKDEMCNPTSIGNTNNVVKGKNHIEKKDCRPRDIPRHNIVNNTVGRNFFYFNI